MTVVAVRALAIPARRETAIFGHALEVLRDLLGKEARVAAVG
jgi:hypothetical protein